MTAADGEFECAEREAQGDSSMPYSILNNTPWTVPRAAQLLGNSYMLYDSTKEGGTRTVRPERRFARAKSGSNAQIERAPGQGVKCDSSAVACLSRTRAQMQGF